MGQTFEIMGNNQKKILSAPSTKNQYFQIGQNNQIVQLLTQPYEYKENQNPNQFQIIQPQNQIETIKKEQVNYGSYDYKQNNLVPNNQQQLSQNKKFKKSIQNKNINNIYRVNNINNLNNNSNSSSLKNSNQSAQLKKKPIHHKILNY